MTLLKKFNDFLENPPIWPIFFGIFGGLLLNNKWSEPDAYAFYNRTCLGGIDFNTPAISKFLFNLIPCEQWIWFGIQALLWTIILYTISWSLKKFLDIDKRAVYLASLSPFVIQLMTSLEDDFLALPIIIVLIYWHMKEKSILSGIVLLIAGAILSVTIWEGSFLILSIVAISVFNPLLGLIEIGFFHFYQSLGSFSYDSANESKFGYGFGEYGLFWFVVALCPKDWRQAITENWLAIKVAIPLVVLTVLVPKFGIYSTIPLLPIAYDFFSKKNYFLKTVKIGFIIFLLFTGLFLFIAPPNKDHWALMKKAVDLQDSGEKVLNYWSIGDYLAFLGGKPSQRGGYAGFQDANGSYWIGYERKNCETIGFAQVLFLQKC